MAKCPVHDDTAASLKIQESDTGNLLLYCFAGCTFQEITQALGLDMTDCFPDSRNDSHTQEIVATYDYEDETGNLLYQVVRFNPKSFRQRRPCGQLGSYNEWAWNLDGVQRVLYKLPELVKPENKRRIIFLVEGEKAVRTLHTLGLLATCASGGAGKNTWRDGYTKFLKNRTVVLLPDNDEPGRNYMTLVAEKLKPTVRRGIILRLSGLKDGGDVYDWLESHSVDDLRRIVEDSLKIPLCDSVIKLSEQIAILKMRVDQLLRDDLKFRNVYW